MEDEVGSETAPGTLALTLDELKAMTRPQLLKLASSNGIAVQPKLKVRRGRRRGHDEASTPLIFISMRVQPMTGSRKQTWLPC